MYYTQENFTDISLEDMLYANIVEEYADKKSDFIFPNSNPIHASIVISNIFRTSNKEVIIYDEDLSGDIADKYPKFIVELESFVKDKKSLKIIIKNKITDKTSSFEENLKYLYKIYSNLIIKRLADNSEFEKDLFKLYDKNFYFTIGDKTKIRIEYDDRVENSERLIRKAFCSFNNSEFSDNILNTINKHFNNKNSFVDYF